MDLPMPMHFQHLKKTSREAVGVHRSESKEQECKSGTLKKLTGADAGRKPPEEPSSGRQLEEGREEPTKVGGCPFEQDMTG